MDRPTLVYDDDCGFCTWWAEYLAGESDIRLVGFSDVDDALRDRLPDDYTRCSHLVTDEGVYSCGASVEEAFVRSNVGESARPLVSFFREFEEYEGARERVYRWVAENRGLMGRIVSTTPPSRRDGAGGGDGVDGGCESDRSRSDDAR